MGHIGGNDLLWQGLRQLLQHFRQQTDGSLLDIKFGAGFPLALFFLGSLIYFLLVFHLVTLNIPAWLWKIGQLSYGTWAPIYGESSALRDVIDSMALTHQEQWLRICDSLSLAQKTNKNNLEVGEGRGSWERSKGVWVKRREV